MGGLSKNVLEVLHHDIANLALYRKWVFSIWDPNRGRPVGNRFFPTVSLGKVLGSKAAFEMHSIRDAEPPPVIPK